MDFHINIRKNRIKKRLTIAELAKRAELTKGFLSMVERGERSPSVAALIKICRSLEVDIASLFEQQASDSDFAVVRKNERKEIVKNSTFWGYRYESLAWVKQQKKMEPFIATFPISHRTRVRNQVTHNGEEMVYLLSGKVEFVYGDKSPIELRQGDCVYFNSSVPHKIVRVGKKEAKALVVVFAEG